MAGVKDVIKTFAMISAVVAISEVVGRSKTMAEAKARHDSTKARLDSIERGIEAIRAKLR